MINIETSAEVAAPAHTVWAVLDEFDTHNEWNPCTADITGRSTLGSHITTTLVRQNTPDVVVVPVISRVVASRQLRWQAESPDESVFSAVHTFTVVPTGPNTCVFHNDEIFSGTAIEPRIESLNVDTRASYEKMTLDIKARAEAQYTKDVAIHSSVNSGVTKGTDLEGATLRCACETNPVELRLNAACSHNHLCGCSACWKPEGQLMAQVAVVPAGTVDTISGEDKLAVVDASAKIQRHACKDCGCHVIGRVDNKDHHFFGLDFIHPELVVDAEPPQPEFAGFVSSLVENGTSPTLMAGLRDRLSKVGVPSFDAFSPEIMDAIAWHKLKIARYPDLT
jgi:S-(hydroxymethyl)glutathione synthase